MSARRALPAAALAWALGGACAGDDDAGGGEPGAGPPRAAAVDERMLDALLARMSLRDKIGQLVMAEIRHATPDDARRWRLGAVLNGGGSFPGGARRASARDWLELAARFHDASIDRDDGRARIPVLWGTDAVHGHNNAFGATVFPHNIGLGAARDAELARRIARATAAEVLATGLLWTFAPTLAVPRDDRWGRVYEGFSEEPQWVARLGAAMVEGFQGRLGEGFMTAERILATAKHFIGDGGTAGGVDQGDTQLDEAELLAVHGAGYRAALAAGAQVVMASFNSWNGDKLHGHRHLLTGVLKGQMGFDGFVLGDWNGHEQLPGCSAASCAGAIVAGVDMIMVPERWREFFDNTLAQARAGEIPAARVDDAVRRILRVKARAGLLDADGEPGPGPHGRPNAGDSSWLGRAAHRALAREAARKSLVLLKNDAGALPLSASSRVLVAGAADDVPMQMGGWSVTWQGTETAAADFPGAVSIWAGVRDAVSAAGGVDEFHADGDYQTRPDAAIVVFGEAPYAEGPGDVDTLEFAPDDKSHLATMRRLRDEGVAVIAVLLSGRPLWVNPELNAADAFVAAWLPGAEAGGALADALFCARARWASCGFSGRLGFSWPARADQFALNAGEDSAAEALFGVGYGLRYEQRTERLRTLSERTARAARGDIGRTLFSGRGAPPFRARVQEGDSPPVSLDRHEVRTASGAVAATIFDRSAQEDSLRLRFDGSASARWRLDSARPHDWRDEARRGAALALELRVLETSPSALFATMRCGDSCAASLRLDALLAERAGGDWFTLGVGLECFARAGADLSRVYGPLALESRGAWRLELSRLRLQAGLAADSALRCD